MLIHISELKSGQCGLKFKENLGVGVKNIFMVIVYWFISPCVFMSPVLLVVIYSGNLKQNLFITYVVNNQHEAVIILISNNCLCMIFRRKHSTDLICGYQAKTTNTPLDDNGWKSSSSNGSKFMFQQCTIKYKFTQSHTHEWYQMMHCWR